MAKYIVCFLLSLSIIAIGVYIFRDTPMISNNTYANLMRIQSSAFTHNAMIPSKYTCDGENISPPLAFSDIPKDAKSLVLVMEDPDAPAGTWVHWLLWNIPAQTTGIREGTVPTGASEGATSFGTARYGGPCPPARNATHGVAGGSEGEHHYLFRLYALDTELELPEETKKEGLEEVMVGHVLDKAEIIGLYNHR